MVFVSLQSFERLIFPLYGSYCLYWNEQNDCSDLKDDNAGRWDIIVRHMNTSDYNIIETTI